MCNCSFWGSKLTHFNIEADRFGKLLEQILQSSKWCLNVITPAVTLETLLFEVPSMLHLLAEFGGIKS